jgi:hypothetical protein
MSEFVQFYLIVWFRIVGCQSCVHFVGESFSPFDLFLDTSMSLDA